MPPCTRLARCAWQYRRCTNKQFSRAGFRRSRKSPGVRVCDHSWRRASCLTFSVKPFEKRFRVFDARIRRLCLKLGDHENHRAYFHSGALDGAVRCGTEKAIVSTLITLQPTARYEGKTFQAIQASGERPVPLVVPLACSRAGAR
jgi:hypothetical protein